jgi:protein subunit release factor A
MPWGYGYNKHVIERNSSWLLPSQKWRSYGNASTASVGGFDLAHKQTLLDGLEQQAADPDLWNNPTNAQQVMQRMTRIKNELNRWASVDARLQSTAEFAELGDDSLADDVAREYGALLSEIDALEIEVLLSGPYDDRDAFLSIKAGMGGTDAADWAEMLLRTYTRWAEKKNFTCHLVDQTIGEEAGIKSATLETRPIRVRRRLRSSKCCPKSTMHPRSASNPKTSAWTSIAPVAMAAKASIRLTRRCA